MISKQEAHGPHRSSEKTVQINKHIYIITLIKRRKITLLTLWEFIVFSFEEIESPSPKDALCQDWLKLAQWLWRRGFFNFVNVFSLFHNYLPLEKSRALHLNKLESPSPEDALCQVWLKLAQWFWRRRWKCEKFIDTRTDDGQQPIRKAYLSFQLRWAKHSRTHGFILTFTVYNLIS